MIANVELEGMSVAEKIQLVETLWDSIAATPDDVPLTEMQKLEIDRRLEAHRKNPQEGVSWQSVRAKMQKA